MSAETLAEALAQEDELVPRRFVHHTRTKGKLSLEQAMALSKIMAGDRIFKPDFPFCELPNSDKDSA